jgi:hypothetical protein
VVQLCIAVLTVITASGPNTQQHVVACNNADNVKALSPRHRQQGSAKAIQQCLLEATFAG